MGVAQDKHNELAMVVGIAVTKWANLESSLALLFAKMLRLTNEQACSLLAHVKTFQLMLLLVDTAVKFRLTATNDKFWNSLVEYIRELSGDRNYFAHSGIIWHAPGPPESTPEHLVEPKVGPSMIAHMANKKQIDAMDVVEIRELTLDIQEAVEMLMGFSDVISSGQPFPEKFLIPVVRRRPPRKLRREALGKAQPPPPQASQE